MNSCSHKGLQQEIQQAHNGVQQRLSIGDHNEAEGRECENCEAEHAEIDVRTLWGWSTGNTSQHIAMPRCWSASNYFHQRCTPFTCNPDTLSKRDIMFVRFGCQSTRFHEDPHRLSAVVSVSHHNEKAFSHAADKTTGSQTPPPILSDIEHTSHGILGQCH